MEVFLIMKDGSKVRYDAKLIGRRVKIRNIVEGLLETRIFKPEDGSRGYWAEVPINPGNDPEEIIKIRCDFRGAALPMGDFSWKELDCKKDELIRKVKDLVKSNWGDIYVISGAGLQKY